MAGGSWSYLDVLYEVESFEAGFILDVGTLDEFLSVSDYFLVPAPRSGVIFSLKYAPPEATL